MVKASVDIFEHEDSIVEQAKEKYGFRTKNDALNFIIRKFEKHLKEVNDEKSKEVHEFIEAGKMPDIFEDKDEKKGKLKTRKKGSKKLKDEKEKQNLDLLKNVLSER